MKFAVVACIAAVSSAALADPLAPASYAMHNGDGVASGGAYNYWDLGYSGSGATDVDDALLAGGRGDLTDGVVSGSNWFDVENIAGTGPYVGWNRNVLPGAVAIRFDFAAPVAVDTIVVHADDSGGAGGVSLPGTVTFTWAGGSTTRNVVDPDPNSTAPAALSFAGLGIGRTSFVEVSLTYTDTWIFVDEVSFAGAVPEPASGALLAAGVAALGLGAARRRR